MAFISLILTGLLGVLGIANIIFKDMNLKKYNIIMTVGHSLNGKL